MHYKVLNYVSSTLIEHLAYIHDKYQNRILIILLTSSQTKLEDDSKINKSKDLKI